MVLTSEESEALGVMVMWSFIIGVGVGYILGKAQQYVKKRNKKDEE